MPASLATLVYLGLMAWMAHAHVVRSGRKLGALWIPLIWALILGSRPVSVWFGVYGGDSANPVNYDVEGSPLDRLVFIGLIASGVFVLSRRAVNLSQVLSANQMMFVLLGFWAISTLWSDYTFVSIKRLLKELGNVIMALVVLTDRRPGEALRYLFVRCAIILVPASVLLIKYYPDLGRSYNRWTWENMYTGVTLHKNSLGCLLLVGSIFVVFDFLESNGTLKGKELFRRKDTFLLLAMSGWLFNIANSKTAIVCTVIACSLLVFIYKRPDLSVIVQTWVPIAAVVLWGLDSLFDIKGAFLKLLGRDPTLTERTGLWDMALTSNDSPLLGAGFYSYWLTSAAEHILSTYHSIKQVHNGYIECYLDGGVIGLLFLVCFLFVSWRKACLRVQDDQGIGRMALVMLYVLVLYNFTEASFFRLSLVWFAFLSACLDNRGVMVGAEAPESNPIGDPGYLTPEVKLS